MQLRSFCPALGLFDTLTRENTAFSWKRLTVRGAYLFCRCTDKDWLSLKESHENWDKPLQEKRVDRPRCVMLEAITKLACSFDLDFDI